MQTADKPLANRKNCLQCNSVFGLRLVEGLHKFYYFCPNHNPAFQRQINVREATINNQLRGGI